MRWQNILQTLLFAVFFGVGAAAIFLSIRCDELLGFYKNKQLLKSAEKTLSRLESLSADYDALLQQLEKDPNLIKRIAPVTLGVEPQTDADTIYPQAAIEQLDTIREALAKQMNEDVDEPVSPLWLSRCSKPWQRISIFLAGAALVLISFIWFSRPKRSTQKPDAAD